MNRSTCGLYTDSTLLFDKIFPHSSKSSATNEYSIILPIDDYDQEQMLYITKNVVANWNISEVHNCQLYFSDINFFLGPTVSSSFYLHPWLSDGPFYLGERCHCSFVNRPLLSISNFPDTSNLITKIRCAV